MTVEYRKPGMITSHRQVHVPWNGIATVETIQMIGEDPVSTDVVFDGDPGTVTTHQSTTVTDEFGSRSCTMVFTGDNRAYMTDENGADITELATVSVRATEFVTPESMPAVLPPASAYTYCAELGADGISRIRFEKPVIVWVDNFLKFDAGSIVPVGYYDRDSGVWVPSDNGTVVKLLDTDGDNITDALDADGNGSPDDLDGDGSYADEVTGLDDPVKYAPESLFWRVEVKHFTPWDCNWPYGPPAGATNPNSKDRPNADEKCKGDCKKKTGSFAEQRSRIFHEDIPVPGTDMTLHYASNRVKGYQQIITVPASGDTVPDSLKQIIVRVNGAGQTFQEVLEPLPNQVVELVWDGRDFLGREVVGTVIFTVETGFLYDAVYKSPADFQISFAQSGGSATTIRARQEIILWKKSELSVESVRGVIAEGWTLSAHHQAHSSAVLYKGDGTKAVSQEGIITTVAHYTDDDYPGSVLMDKEGNLYVAKSDIIEKTDQEGNTVIFAGIPGSAGFSGDGGPAVEAELYCPVGMSFDPAGNMYFVMDGYNIVRKIDRNGIISTVAGNGTKGFCGDGGPAAEACLNDPLAASADAFGNLYIADNRNNRIRKVDSGGIISTCMNFEDYFEDYKYGAEFVTVDSYGNLFMSVSKSERYWENRVNQILRMDPQGNITQIAGVSCPEGYSGDGGPATDACFNYPTYLTADSMGNLYVSDCVNYRIRKIDANGMVTTVAGNGISGYSGDGSFGVRAMIDLNELGELTVDPENNLYFSDWQNKRVRKISEIAARIGDISDGEYAISYDRESIHIMSASGLHKRTLDRDTRAVLYTFGYDAEDRLVSITDRFDNKVTVERSSSGVPTAIISPYSHRTELAIDEHNQLKRITYPDENYYDFEYDYNDGLLTAKTEPKGNRFEHDFDENGRLYETRDDEQGKWIFSRKRDENGNFRHETLTAENNLTTFLDYTDSAGAYTSVITAPSGAETLFSRSSDGLEVRKSLPCGTDFEFKYGTDTLYKFTYVNEMTETTPAGITKVFLRDKIYKNTSSGTSPNLITETVTVNGKETVSVHNTLPATKTVTSPENRTVTTVYDPATLLTSSVSVPGLLDTTYGYDEKGRLKSVKTGTRETLFDYDTDGNLDFITDPENHTTYFDYDETGRVKEIHRPDMTDLYFDYDANGNMEILTVPKPEDRTVGHSFGYNNVNLESSYTTPMNKGYGYTYDRDRRLIKKTFPSGDETNYVYEPGKDRLEQIQTPEGNIDYTYYPCGTNVETVSKGGETLTYEYDGSLVTKETFAGTLNLSLGYKYNNDFDIEECTYAGNTETYAYDDDGLLTGAGNFTVARKPENGLPEAVTGGNLNLTRAFNDYGETESENYAVSSQGKYSWSVIRDENGKIRRKTEIAEDVTSVYVYDYDPVGRLLTVKDGNDTLLEEYRYDPNGTRNYEMNTRRGIAGRSLTYYDDDCLMSAGDALYEYDSDG
ncbi:MAG: hypothetical protein GY795_31035, partial [Desulfobacterales bacterium]|nr:hypothetical protein [Desulfobacterales bacterium]